MVEEFLGKLPEIDTRYEDIVPMEQVSSMVTNGGGNVAMQRDDEYRTRMMKTEEDISDKASTCGKLLILLSVALVILTLPFSLFVCFKVVQEYERAVIFRLGRLMQGGAKGPGIFFILPCIDSYARVDLRTRTYDVPPQEVLTKDSVTVSVDAVVYYRVSNATVSIANVENAHHSTRLLAQTTLRNTMGTSHLHEILSEREAISGNMQIQLDEATDAWGIKVERVEIKDVRLPVQLQRAMAAEAEAAREARAKVIAAEGEQKASRALREASEVIAGSPAALQLRYLQTLNSISAEKNSTIVFPLPIDLITYFLKSNDANNQNVQSPIQSIASHMHHHHQQQQAQQAHQQAQHQAQQQAQQAQQQAQQQQVQQQQAQQQTPQIPQQQIQPQALPQTPQQVTQVTQVTQPTQAQQHAQQQAQQQAQHQAQQQAQQQAQHQAQQHAQQQAHQQAQQQQQQLHYQQQQQQQQLQQQQQQQQQQLQQQPELLLQQLHQPMHSSVL